MSSTGKVIRWKGPYGFATTDDGTIVYIHTSEIDGGRLRMGLNVNFDIEKVDGHDGRVKGTNVSGEAVLKKGERLSDDDFKADRERMKEVHAERKADLIEEYEPVKAQVDTLSRSGKMHLVAELMKELDLGTLGAHEERRADPTDPHSAKRYTRAEFLQFYGSKKGAAIWGAAKKGGA